MDFGRPTDPALVDWTLAPDTALTQLSLKQVTSPDVARVYIGSTAWAQKDLVGLVYPKRTKSTDFLQAYGKQFNSIELNTTYYRTPEARQVEKWRIAVPSDFRFCPKVNKAISQAKDLGIHTRRTMDFAKSVQHFEQKLGPCFMQLPSHFATDNIDALRTWLDTWPPTLRLAIELRHESWFCESEGQDLFADLYARGIGAVITDVGGRRDVSHMNVTTRFAMIRWVGNMHATDQQRLDDFAARTAKWLGNGLSEVYMFTHQPAPIPSAESAAFFELCLRKHYKGEMVVRSPKPLIPDADASQAKLF